MLDWSVTLGKGLKMFWQFHEITTTNSYNFNTRFGPVLDSWMYFTIKKNTESESRNGLASVVGSFYENTKTHLSPTKLFWRSGGWEELCSI